jgi:hypothetical protein
VFAALALAAALCLAAALAFAGVGDGGSEPAPRVQYGAHAGEPAAYAGAGGRVALDGRWRVAMDPAGTGGARGYATGEFPGEAVELPHVPNAKEIVGEPGVRSHEGSVAWYRTTLKVPRDGQYALRFESVNHRATVYLDGRRVGGHVGVYLPFEIRTPLEAGREHTLVVRADWRDPDAMKAASWHRTWFNFGGINREVTIRPLAASEVVSPTVRTVLERGGRRARIEIAARVRNLGTEPQRIALRGTLAREGSETDIRFPEVDVPVRASREVRVRFALDDPALWSQTAPNLYDLELRAGEDEAESYRARVGLRELRRDGTRMLLNGEPVSMIGASLHEDAPGRGDALRPQDMDAVVDQLRAINANATRAQHPLSPALLERLDRAGILVWLGIGPVDAPGAFTAKTPELVEQSRDRVRASLIQLQTHPSIVAWNLANEVANQGHRDGQPAYIDAAARELKERDPGRLVALDVWGSHPPDESGPMYENIDAIGWTNYLGWYEEPYSTTEELTQLIETKLGDFQRVFPDKILAVTEFGAEGTPRNPDQEPGGYSFQARVLRTHIRTYARMEGLSGMLVWNLRDFGVAPSFAGGSIVEVVPDIKLLAGLNEKGLFRYDGTPKLAARVVGDEYAKLTR